MDKISTLKSRHKIYTLPALDFLILLTADMLRPKHVTCQARSAEKFFVLPSTFLALQVQSVVW